MKILVVLTTVLVATAAWAKWGDLPSVLGQFPVQFSATSAVAPYSKFHQFGMTDTQQQNTATVVWDGAGIVYTGQDTTVAARVRVVSTSGDDIFPAGAGAQTIEIFGLDQNFEKINELVDMTGGADTFTNQNFIRVFRGLVRSAGSNGSNVGRISLRNADDISIWYANMFIGANQTLAATYTIPHGKIGFITNWYGSQSSDVPSNTDVRLRYGLPQEPRVTQGIWGLRSGGTDTFERTLGIPKGPLPEHTDIQVISIVDQPLQNTAAGFDIMLFDVN